MNSRTFSFYRDCCYHEGGMMPKIPKKKEKRSSSASHGNGNGKTPNFRGFLSQISYSFLT